MEVIGDLNPNDEGRKKARLRELQQPAAWQPLGKLHELVSMRSLMQEAEWYHRFRDISGRKAEDITDGPSRLDMFGDLVKEGLLRYHLAVKLDDEIRVNEGQRSRISDMTFVCNAWPTCSTGLCHRKAIYRNKGPVRSHFAHFPGMSEVERKAHDISGSRAAHDLAVGNMYASLSPHKASGFVVTNSCLHCNRRFTWLDVPGPIVEYDAEQKKGDPYVYDLVGVDECDRILVVIEAKRLHRIEPEKREYLEQRGYPYIEFLVKNLLNDNRRKGVNLLSNGRVELDAVLLGINCSNKDPLCRDCRQRATREEQAQIRLCEQIRRHEDDAAVKVASLLRPLEENIRKISESVESLRVPLTMAEIRQVDNQLRGLEGRAKGLQAPIVQVKKEAERFQTIDGDVIRDAPQTVKDAYCSQTGIVVPQGEVIITTKNLKTFPVYAEQIIASYISLLSFIDAKKAALLDQEAHLTEQQLIALKEEADNEASSLLAPVEQEVTEAARLVSNMIRLPRDLIEATKAEGAIAAIKRRVEEMADRVARACDPSNHLQTVEAEVTEEFSRASKEAIRAQILSALLERTERLRGSYLNLLSSIDVKSEDLFKKKAQLVEQQLIVIKEEAKDRASLLLKPIEQEIEEVERLVSRLWRSRDLAKIVEAEANIAAIRKRAEEIEEQIMKSCDSSNHLQIVGTEISEESARAQILAAWSERTKRLREFYLKLLSSIDTKQADLLEEKAQAIEEQLKMKTEAARVRTASLLASLESEIEETKKTAEKTVHAARDLTAMVEAETVLTAVEQRAAGMGDRVAQACELLESFHFPDSNDDALKDIARVAQDRLRERHIATFAAHAKRVADLCRHLLHQTSVGKAILSERKAQEIERELRTRGGEARDWMSSVLASLESEIEKLETEANSVELTWKALSEFRDSINLRWPLVTRAEESSERFQSFLTHVAQAHVGTLASECHEIEIFVERARSLTNRYHTLLRKISRHIYERIGDGSKEQSRPAFSSSGRRRN